jgi:hypothetical protein
VVDARHAVRCPDSVDSKPGNGRRQDSSTYAAFREWSFHGLDLTIFCAGEPGRTTWNRPLLLGSLLHLRRVQFGESLTITTALLSRGPCATTSKVLRVPLRIAELTSSVWLWPS